MVTRNASLFHFAFQCPNCDHIIEGSTFLAVIKGPGYVIGCIDCRTQYVVTSDGATPLSDEMRDVVGIDANGKPYKVSLPEIPPRFVDPTKKES